VFHVVNRGLERRSILESRDERRHFLSLLARGVRKSWIRVHAYSLMTNHFHLLITSEGGLSSFMQWAMSCHVRRFNRRRGRDGPLFRGRFWTRRVHCSVDFGNVVRYIDQNAVAAGLVQHGVDYEFGSARHYARGDRRPLWLNHAPVRRLMNIAAGVRGAAIDYRTAFPPVSPSLAWWIERRLATGLDGADPLVDLMRQGLPSPDQLVAWLREQAVGVVASRRRPPIVPLPALLVELDTERTAHVMPGSRDGRRCEPIEALRCGLLAVAVGLNLGEVAAIERSTIAAVRTRCARHAELVLRDAAYARRAALLLIRALREIA